jgi:TnpA family transposase
VCIPTEKQRHYAREFRNHRPAAIRFVQEPARTLQLVCFLRVALMKVTDSIVLGSSHRTLEIVRRAKENVAQADAKSTPHLRQGMAQILKIGERADLEAQAKVDQMMEIARGHDGKVFPSRAAAVRDRLIEKNAEVRALLHAVVTKLPLRAVVDERIAGSLQIMRDLFDRRTSELPRGAEQYLRPMWRREVASEDRARARRAFEVAVMMDLRHALRRGTVWVADSNEFRSREQLLIPPARWERDRIALSATLGVTTGSPTEYLQPLLAKAEEGLARLAETVRHGKLKIVGGAIKISPLEPETLPPGLDAQRAALHERVGAVQLPDLMLEMDSKIHFSRHLLGHAPRSKEELLPLYGGLIATGTEIGARGVSLMTPGLLESQIRVAMHGLEDENVFRRANDEVVAYIRKQEIARNWGGGTIASSDLMSVDVSRRLWLAQNDPHGRGPAVGVYQHVSSRWDIFNNLPMLVKPRQAGAALEGIVRNLDLGIEQLSVDTHGHTHFIMGIFPFFKAALCPRIKSPSDRRLAVPVGVEIPDVLADVVTRKVSIPKIVNGFDPLLRVVASIREGTTSAMVANDRFGSSAAQGDAAHASGEHLGRLRLTIFLCDYYTNETFRREIHRILNHGETLHDLERAIFAGRLGPNRGRRMDELAAHSGALTLLTNLVLAWNTTQLQLAVHQLGREGTTVSPEVLAHISPSFYAHINFRGLFRFVFDRYSASLFREHPVRRAVVAP